MKILTVDQTTDMMIGVCEAIIKNKQYLTEVDSKIGDGDHGIGMSGGMGKAKLELEAKRPFEDVNTVFKTMGMTMLNSMGGASGVIFGSMFFGGNKGLKPIKALDQKSLAVIMRAALESIKARGGAKVGDKTMVDALEPAVIALENEDNKDLEEALRVAKEEALQGVEKTKAYIANFGRAKSLMKRAVGYQDAGATSVAIIFESMYQFVKVI